MPSVSFYMTALTSHVEMYGQKVSRASCADLPEYTGKLLFGFTSPSDTILLDPSLLREAYPDLRLSFWDIVLRFVKEADIARKRGLVLWAKSEPYPYQEMRTCWEYYEKISESVRKHGASKVTPHGAGGVSTPDGNFYIPLDVLRLEYHDVAGGGLFNTIKADVEAFEEAVKKGET